MSHTHTRQVKERCKPKKIMDFLWILITSRRSKTLSFWIVLLNRCLDAVALFRKLFTLFTICLRKRSVHFFKFLDSFSSITLFYTEEISFTYFFYSSQKKNNNFSINRIWLWFYISQLFALMHLFLYEKYSHDYFVWVFFHQNKQINRTFKLFVFFGFFFFKLIKELFLLCKNNKQLIVWMILIRYFELFLRRKWCFAFNITNATIQLNQIGLHECYKYETRTVFSIWNFFCWKYNPWNCGNGIIQPEREQTWIFLKEQPAGK